MSPPSATSGDIRFTLCPAAECPGVESEADFIDAIRAKRQAGKKVLLSIGGANGQVQLTTTAARDKFVSSVSAIIDRYGLDGVDIDFEGHSLSLNTGDTDFKNPTTPVIVNLIAAVRSLKARYGAGFVLTMAPETFFVQLGYQYYGSGPWGGQDPRAGSYLPVIYALRNDLTVLHVQDYNSGSIMGLDNQYHSMGGADFHIAMTDMLLAGFPVAGNTANMFPALREDQVAFGAPSSVSAGNGYVSPPGVQQAVNCLVKGASCGGYTHAQRHQPELPRPDDLVDQLGQVLRLGVPQRPRAVPQRPRLSRAGPRKHADLGARGGLPLRFGAISPQWSRSRRWVGAMAGGDGVGQGDSVGVRVGPGPVGVGPVGQQDHDHLAVGDHQQ